jgi:hypothetical protein
MIAFLLPSLWYLFFLQQLTGVAALEGAVDRRSATAPSAQLESAVLGLNDCWRSVHWRAFRTIVNLSFSAWLVFGDRHCPF